MTGSGEILGERTRLRPLNVGDLALLAEWRNRHRLSFADSSPVTLEGQAAWFASYVGHDDDLMYVIETPDGRPLGCVSLYHVDREAATAEFGRVMIGRADDERHGYAADASQALLEHARTALGLELVYLQVIADNRRAVALYERLRFVRDPSHDASIARDGALMKLAGMSLSLVPEARPASAQPHRPGPPIHVAVVHPGLTPSTYIRLISPLTRLEDRGHVEFTILSEAQLQPSRREIAGRIVRGRSFHREARLRAEQTIRDADVLILQRSTTSTGERALALARASGKSVIYECDDNFLAIDKRTPAVGAYYSAPRVRRRFVRLLAGADVVTTSTRVLADAFGELTGDVRTLPNCVDFTYIDGGPRPAASSGLVIGYAGTLTHGPDFECVEPALRRVLDEGRGAVRLQCFGFVPEALLGRPDVSFVPYSEDYAGFMRALSRVDWSFGIAPLADLPANRGKTNNKYREYGACRIPAVYSDCPVYSGSVADGLTGLLVPHTEEGWYAGLRRMMADAALRESVTRAAYDDVAERYSVEAAAQTWLDTLMASNPARADDRAAHHRDPRLHWPHALDLHPHPVPTHLASGEGGRDPHSRHGGPAAHLTQGDRRSHRARPLVPPGSSPRAEQTIRDADVLILQRSTTSTGERALALARASGKSVIYECDDNFLAIDKRTPAVGAYYSAPRVRRRFVRLLAGADVVTTSTRVLADAFGELTGDVRTLPNCVDFTYIDGGPRPAASSGLVIGYAGTLTHGPDFECVEPALRRVLDEGRGAVRLQCFGFVPEALLGRPDVSFVPYSEDYAGFMRALSRVDWSFGIAPLADLPANRGKTNNKYREYGACRIPAVYSDCPVYSGSVADGLTGLLVPHTEEGWYAGLRRMMADAALRESVTRAAYDDVAERYSVEAAAQTWLDTLHGVQSRTRR